MSLGVIASSAVISSGSTTYKATVLADNPAAYWRCEESVGIYAVTASSIWNGTSNPPWAAFADDVSGAWISNNTATAQLQVQLTSAAILTQYSFVREDFNAGQRSPNAWTFQGSNDGSTWTTLDTQTGIVWSVASERKTFTFTNTTAYLYYRIAVTATNGDTFLTIKGMILGSGVGMLANAAGTTRRAVPFHLAMGVADSAPLGAAVTFDGSTSRADVPYVSSWMDLTTAFSIEAWVKTTATGVHSIADRDGGSSRVYQFRINGANLEFLKISGGGVGASQACNINDGAWHHVVGTYDGANIRLYKDGVLINTTAAAGTLAGTDSLTIGVNNSAGYNAYWNGQLDEIAYYRAVLSATQVQAHFDAGATYAQEVMADTPALFLKLNDASGSGTAADSSGNARNFTATSATFAQASLLGDGTNSSVTFNGTSAYLSGGNVAWMNSNTVTVEFRYRHTASAGTSLYLGRWGSSGARPWLITVNANKVTIQIDDSGALITSVATLTDATNYTIALRCDNSTVKLFINGVEDSSISHAGPTQNGSFEVARAGGTAYSPGWVQGLAFWTTALSATRLAAHHAAASRMFYDGLVVAKTIPNFFWKMDEAAFTNGQLLVDSSGNGHSLTLNGTGFSVGASLLNSKQGGSLVSSGASGTYGRLTAAAWLNPTSFTFTCLVNLRSGDNWHFNRWGVSSGQRDWVVIPGGWYSAWVGGSQHDLAGGSGVSPTISLGIHHIAYRLSYNGSATTQTLFVDGTVFATRTDSGSINTNLTDLIVGGDTTSTPVAYPIQVSRVAHYSVALADADIAALATAA